MTRPRIVPPLHVLFALVVVFLVAMLYVYILYHNTTEIDQPKTMSNAALIKAVESCERNKAITEIYTDRRNRALRVTCLVHFRMDTANRLDSDTPSE